MRGSGPSKRSQNTHLLCKSRVKSLGFLPPTGRHDKGVTYLIWVYENPSGPCWRMDGRGCGAAIIQVRAGRGGAEVGRLGVTVRELDSRAEWMARIMESEEAREEVTFLAPAKMR